MPIIGLSKAIDLILILDAAARDQAGIEEMDEEAE
jgi:hypothetical protein